MDWLRLYAEFASDPKVQMMSEAMQRRLIMLFCLQCSNGIETFHETERDAAIAFAMRISEEEVAQTKALFLRKGFIKSDWTLCNWSKRQYASDSSTARVRAHREKKKQAADKEKDDETLHDRSSNAPEQNRTEVNPSPSFANAQEGAPPIAAKQKRKTQTFASWLDELKTTGEKAISEYAPVWRYAEKVKLPADWIQLAWLRFKQRYQRDEKAAKKRYADWRRVFLNAVEGNWLRLWCWSERDQAFRLSTTGMQADAEFREAA
ncbi:hypothetical protein GPA19_05275 [Azoarcus indigens]|uniref:Uncharacterized protein n=1 Tax=Azoarcus indigens TaxID=29545 RepID=A0A4R6DVF6_9RHOO|nr:hypothetical protein [Azoarcus indigens]NMG64356.1 hypothetical protein [Azoarcus indigens]TDN49191.1 hypothetical protein C7389_11242 [Azoarcus indigens]